MARGSRKGAWKAERKASGSLDQGERAGGRQAEAAALTLRLPQRRCGAHHPPQQQARLQTLPLSQLEALADAVLVIQGPDDLSAWLRANDG